MHTIDHETRLAIAQAVPETISVITLSSGVRLRLFCHAGHVAIELVDEPAPVQLDLFEPEVPTSQDALGEAHKVACGVALPR